MVDLFDHFIGGVDFRGHDGADARTRAEASDVTNTILDGANTIMLSGETSVGKYSIITVKTMARIIEAVENQGRSARPR